MPRTRIGLRFSRYFISILLILAASVTILSALTAKGGLLYHSISPTITYSGYLGTSYNGTYRYVVAKALCDKSFPTCFQEDEVVFYLDTGREVIRLIFYCGTDYSEYCRSVGEVPLRDGTCVLVKGTLLIPSKWPTDQFTPSLQFAGDLYVFQYSTFSESSCQ